MADLSALFYFSNWWQIAASGNYFVATGAVSPLTHTWSLAVEEQFYLVWPLVVLAVLSWQPLRRERSVDRGIRVLLVACRWWAWWPRPPRCPCSTTPGQHHPALLRHRHPRPVDPGRLGAGLCPDPRPDAAGATTGMAPTAALPVGPVVLFLLGLAGLAGTLALTYTLTGTSAFAYRGGFLLSALSAAAIIIGAVCVPGGPIARVLSLRPLVWMGTVSYGAYLWHYPVFIELDAGPHRPGRASRCWPSASLPPSPWPRPATTWWSARSCTGCSGGRSRPPPRPSRCWWPRWRWSWPEPWHRPPPRSGCETTCRPRAPGADRVRAFTTHPVKFMLVGDSLAVTLAVGLSVQCQPVRRPHHQPDRPRLRP